MTEKPGPELKSLNAKSADRNSQKRRDVIFLKPPRHRDGEPEDRGEMPDGTPMVHLSVPDVAAQLVLVGDACPPQAQLDSDAQALRNLVGRFFPAVDVRPACRPARGGAVETFGLWLDASNGPDESAARDRSLATMTLLQDEETFGLFIKSRAVDALAQSQFASMPHRITSDGRPQADGPVHLQRLSVEIHAPNQVITRVTGFDDRPWPDVDFTAVITDTFVPRQSIFVCAHDDAERFPDIACDSASDVDIDDGDVALAVLLGLGAAYYVPLLGGYFFEQLGEAAFSGGGGGGGAAGASEGGVGCAILRLAHAPILRAGRGVIGSKLIPTFQRMTLNEGGIFLSGQRNLCIRRPTVGISGPASLSTPAEVGTVAGRYAARTADTFGRLQFRWSAPGAHVESPTASSTRIIFDVDAERPGLTHQTVRLDVTDGDGPLPQATLTVGVRSIPRANPPRGDRPPRHDN